MMLSQNYSFIVKIAAWFHILMYHIPNINAISKQPLRGNLAQANVKFVHITIENGMHALNNIIVIGVW